MSSFNFQINCLLLLAIFGIADGIYCYRCTGKKCNTYYGQIFNCTPDEVCLKTVAVHPINMNTYSDYSTTRNCHKPPPEDERHAWRYYGKDESCYATGNIRRPLDANVGLPYEVRCYCDTDYCNASVIPTKNFSLLIYLILLILGQ